MIPPEGRDASPHVAEVHSQKPLKKAKRTHFSSPSGPIATCRSHLLIVDESTHYGNQHGGLRVSLLGTCADQFSCCI